MTNEELVELIQGGERELLPELWAQVERFVAQQARHRLVLSGGLGGGEFGDLYDAGYLALVSAVDSFDVDAGRSFISWLALKLKGAFAEAGGYRSHKQSLDPLHRAGSLDEPMGEDEDSSTLGELIPDPKAEAAILAVEDREQLSLLCMALEWALSTLPGQQRDTLRRRYYQGMTIAEIAAAEGVSRQTVYLWHNKGLRALRHPRTARKLNAYQ